VTDQLDVLNLIAARLDALGIHYMLTGSVAAGWYGQPRMTRDIDLVAVLHPPHADRLATALADEFECDADVMRQAIVARRPFTVFHRASVHKIDIVVRHDTDYEMEKFDRRRHLDMDGQRVWVIAPEDLILSKLTWAKQRPSELQLRDIQGQTMKDTINDSEAAFARRFALVAPIDRLRMVSEMFESAKRLIAASVRSSEPDITDAELRVRIFDRLYADDFDEATKVKLRAVLRRL